MRKSEITFHADGYSSHRLPAVNVKVHRFEPTDAAIATVASDLSMPRFTRAAIDELTDEARQFWWDAALAEGWELLQTDAEQIYGPHIRVYGEGRSSGWAVLGYEYTTGRHSPFASAEDVRGWDAIALAKWAKFAKWAREIADDTPARYVMLIAINVYEPAAERAAYMADPQRQIEI